MVIEGFSIWSKEDGEGGILNDILEQKFEVVEPEFTDEIWVTLLAQAPLSIDTLDRNCRSRQMLGLLPERMRMHFLHMFTNQR